MLFYKITLQNKRLQLRVCNNIFKPGNVRYHLLNFCSFISAALKILAYSVFQAHRLANVNDVIFFIMHNIDSRLCRKLF